MKNKEIHALARKLAANRLSKFRTWKRAIKQNIKYHGTNKTRQDAQDILEARLNEPK
jgi:hypothetical protein